MSNMDSLLITVARAIDLASGNPMRDDRWEEAIPEYFKLRVEDRQHKRVDMPIRQARAALPVARADIPKDF